MAVKGSGLEEYLRRLLAPADPIVLEAIERGPIDPGAALPLAEIDRLLDPAPLGAQTGWCVLPNGVGYVAVQTEMPGITAEMIDWWFDWHARDPLRYRIWHPMAHVGNSFEAPRRPGAKPHWGAVHHPVQDVGTGVVRSRITYTRPRAVGFSSDAIDDPAVGTVVCGFLGDDRRGIRHSVMAHVFLAEPCGLILRTHYWLGAAMRPYLPGHLGRLGGRALNRRAVRKLVLPPDAAPGLARHSAEEFANLALLLPGLYARFG